MAPVSKTGTTNLSQPVAIRFQIGTRNRLEIMQITDFSTVIVLYNLVIGILLMLSSEKLATFAGSLNGSNPLRITRLARVSTFTFGATAAMLSAFIYIVFHLIKIGV